MSENDRPCDSSPPDDEIVQGDPRCLICFGELPCRNHPTPPKLSFAGGTHFEENPRYKKDETPRELEAQVGGVSDDPRPFTDDVDRPRGNSAMADGAGNAAPTIRQDVQPPLQGAIPLPVKQASERLTAGVNPEAVELLEAALSRAKAGVTLTVAVAEVLAEEGCTLGNWSGGGHFHRLHSAVQRLAYKLVSDEGEPYPVG